ncbi:MAG: hypothetical protein ABEJ78_06010 [Haloferacaceae archaeon]
MTDRLSSARRVVERERRTCADEREAFRAFRRRVGELTPASIPATPRASISDSPDAGTSLDRVREAYEDTVMAVPHYEREYGDGYAESLAAEFGGDVAAAVFGSRTLTPELRDALTAAARSAQAEREEFLDLLDREAESVAVADAELDELFDDLRALDSTPLPERGFDELVELRTALEHAESRLDHVAARRQEALSDHRRALPTLDVDVTDYLYGDFDSIYPVLATVAEFGDLVGTATRRVDRAIASTP